MDSVRKRLEEFIPGISFAKCICLDVEPPRTQSNFSTCIEVNVSGKISPDLFEDESTHSEVCEIRVRNYGFFLR